MRFLALVVVMALPMRAQWDLPVKKVDLKAATPKAADGHPDLSGIWEGSRPHFLNLMQDMKEADRPYLPISRDIVESRKDGAQGRFEPDANCLPQGVPKINNAPVPFKIVQTPNLVVLVYEAFNLWRQVHLDGRKTVDDPSPTWLGYSTGHWDGDTLVVETTGLNGRSWLDMAGNPASEHTKVTERFHRTSMGTIELGITIADPTLYSKPWNANEQLKLVTDTEIMEFICNENEKDIRHMSK